MTRFLASTFFNVLMALPLSSFADSIAEQQLPLPTTVTEMRIELDRINFNLQGDAKLEQLKKMVAHSEMLAKQNKQDAAFQMIAGFYNAQYAGEIGSISALKFAKTARDYLEASVRLDPSIYGASAHAVLGTLYRRVPGWPVGYGNKKKALKHYQDALAIAPTGLDSNFTYASYLFEKKKYTEARAYLEKAKVAPARPNRPEADAKVKEVIQQMMVAIDNKS